MIKHRYAHEIDPNGGSAAAVLARMVEPGQRVLELGTGPGTVTRILHSKGCKVTGIEMDPETLATCAPFCERTVLANLEDPIGPRLWQAKSLIPSYVPMCLSTCAIRGHCCSNCTVF